MELTIATTLFLVLVGVIFYAIFGTLKKAIFLTLVTFAVGSAILVILIVSDARQLSQIEESDSLFIYTEENIPKFSIKINFLNPNPTIFDQETTAEKYNLINTDPKKLEEEYFKTFVFSRESLEELLQDEVHISEGLKISKEEVLEGISSTNPEESASFFTTAVLNVFQNLKEQETFLIFLKQYKEKNVQIHPPIKAISVLSLMPENIVRKATPSN